MYTYKIFSWWYGRRLIALFFFLFSLDCGKMIATMKTRLITNLIKIGHRVRFERQIIQIFAFVSLNNNFFFYYWSCVITRFFFIYSSFEFIQEKKIIGYVINAFKFFDSIWTPLLLIEDKSIRFRLGLNWFYIT